MHKQETEVQKQQAKKPTQSILVGGIVVSNRSKVAMKDVELFNSVKNANKSRWFTEDGYFMVNGRYNGVSIFGVYTPYDELLAALLSSRIFVNSTYINMYSCDAMVQENIENGKLDVTLDVLTKCAITGLSQGITISAKVDESKSKKTY